mmetsp:Transcript_12006/g.14931  ORF Transcript_12006/g.14931 Transcript_12006/m.14931 type:complete len:92 (+) Transcript_12006:584-859(+)
MFCIAFTQKRPNQIKKTWYAQAGQIRQIRKKMVDIMTAEASKCDLKDLVAKFIPETIGKVMIQYYDIGFYNVNNPLVLIPFSYSYLSFLFF